MEKIKDFLYDISDIVISILIIAVIFAVISWKLNDTITLKKPVLTETTTVDNKVVELDTTDVQAEDISNSTDKPIGETDTTEDTPSDTNTEVEVVETPVEQPTETQPAVREVTFEIPKGAIGYSIAKSLQENGLIKDANEFLKQIEDMGVGNKLNAGTFKLNTGMDNITIIKILARIK